MPRLVSAYVIYNMQTNSYVDDGSLVTINCDLVNAFTPRRIWLQRWLAPGDGTTVIYQPTYNVNSTDIAQYGTNLIQGFYVQIGSMSVIVDVATIDTFTSACNACCDGLAVTLARYYTSGITLFAAPTTAEFCITRLDDGSAYAHNQAALAYSSQYVNNFRLRSNLSGVSKYSVSSFTGWAPVGIGADTVASGRCP